ncbi:MAG: LicD family protein [Candidatus Omnitrophica bacterium]|nr:LicD family protein [Candidatus Omnitrophota bacterium]
MDQSNYKKITLPEIQEIMIARLKEVVDFLDKNNIDYFATYGTALGAYRHKGFIPWDDDIDLGMTRENYNRFLKIAKQLENDHFIILGYHFSKHIEHGLTKIGIKGTYCPQRCLKKNYDTHFHIDIFPYDSVPSDSNKAKKIARKTKSIKNKLYFKTRKNSSTKLKSLILCLYQAILSPLSTRSLAKKLDNLAQKYNEIEPSSKYVVDVMAAYPYEKQAVSRDYVTSTVLADFATIKIRVPNNCNKFLEGIYGPTFMTPSGMRFDQDTYYALVKKDFVV